jgi:hypothetical protein
MIFVPEIVHLLLSVEAPCVLSAAGKDFEAHLATMITETQDEVTRIRELTITALQKRMTHLESYLNDKESW